MTLALSPLDVFRGPTLLSTGLVGSQLGVFHSPSPATSTAWPTANQAYLIPFAVSIPITYVEMFFLTGTTPGTTAYDLGIYREDFTRVSSLGATSSVNTTDALLPAGGGALTSPAVLARGRYYLAMSSAATTLTVRANVQANQIVRALGMQTAATSHPLPTTITPASMGTTAFIPVFGATTVTNIL